MNSLGRKINNYLLPATRLLYSNLALSLTKKDSRSVLLVAEFEKYGGTRTYFEQLCRYLHQRSFRCVCLVREIQVDDAFLQLLAELNFSYHILPGASFVNDYWDDSNLSLRALYLSKYFSSMAVFSSYCKTHRANRIIISSGDPDAWHFLFRLPVRHCHYILHTLPFKAIAVEGRKIMNNKLSRNKNIISVSTFAVHTILRQWGIPALSRPFVYSVPNYFDDAESADGKPTGDLQVLTLGHLAEYKNPFVWIEVARKVKAMASRPVEFIWAGDGTLLQRCLEMTEEDAHIHFIGYQKDVHALYKNATIYFQPSLIESQGMAVIGAMAYKLPCVVSNTGGLPESVEHNQNGFVVNPLDVSTMSAHILELLNSEGLRGQMGASSRAVFEQRFTKDRWENSMNKII
ncbi:MAG: hypothetical protein JWQ27_180 [Ferruginibacter sp.]|nr:hypothetical protein [Ferruginibacter sp.]